MPASSAGTTATAALGVDRAPVVFSARRPSTWASTARQAWHRSLRFRTLVVTLAATAVAILIACVLIALAIQNFLFDSRLQQVLADAKRTTVAAQATLDSAAPEGDRVQIQNLMFTANREIARQTTSHSYAVFLIGTPSATAPQDFRVGAMSEDLISTGLRDRVRSAAATTQWWQSVSLPDAADATQTAGIVVGQQLVVPEVGPYEFYIAYDLSDAEQTLGFVQRTLWLAGAALVLLIGGIAWFVLRSVATPIAEAAETSARLAAGELEVRLPVRGEDELATLGRSFNAMADSIQGQIKELAELSLVQQRFVSDVSHELRTPLTTIRLAADILNDHRTEFDAPTSRAAELLHAQVQRFEVLLGDLLEISRYDAGSVQLELEPTSLAHLAEDVIASMQHLAEQHGSDVRLVAPGGYSPVDMDARRVRRVLRNLLGNAIEHGEGRPIVVTVDSDQHSVALGVRDYGLGMSDADVEHVFDRFWRADPSRKRSIGGTGLGLSIALGDARLHGGTLAVWSRAGGGSNFVLTLPRRPGDDVRSTPVRLDPGSEEASGLDDLGMTQPIEVLTSEETQPAGAGEREGGSGR